VRCVERRPLQRPPSATPPPGPPPIRRGRAGGKSVTALSKASAGAAPAGRAESRCDLFDVQESLRLDDAAAARFAGDRTPMVFQDPHDLAQNPANTIGEQIIEGDPAPHPSGRAAAATRGPSFRARRQIPAPEHASTTIPKRSGRHAPARLIAMALSCRPQRLTPTTDDPLASRSRRISLDLLRALRREL